MTLEETIPVDEEGAMLLHSKPKSFGIRRVVVAAAAVSFALGLLAATAVTSPGRHASNLHSKHEHETTAVDDEGEVQGRVEQAAVADRPDVRP